MKKAQKKTPAPLVKATSQVKFTVTSRLDRVEELPPFMKKKLENGERIIAITGLPK